MGMKKNRWIKLKLGLILLSIAGLFSCTDQKKEKEQKRTCYEMVIDTISIEEDSTLDSN